MKKGLLLYLILIFGFSIFWSCEEVTHSEKKDRISIGALLPYTGSMALMGVKNREAMELAIYEINQKGGVLGKELDLLVKDTQTDASMAVPAAQELIKEDIVGIAGAIISSSTLNVAKHVAIPSNMLMFSPSSTSPLITNIEDETGTDLVFRSIISDAIGGQIAAMQASSLSLFGKAGVIFIDNAYGQGLAASFKETYEMLGGQVINYVSYPELSADELYEYDFSEKAKNLFKNKPDLVYLITFATDGALFTLAAQQYFTSSYQPVVIGCDGNQSKDFLINASPTVVEGMYSIVSTPNTDLDEYNYFESNYRQKYNKAPEIYLENAYDIIYILALAILESNSTEPAEIAKHIRSVTNEGEKVNAENFEQAKTLIEQGKDIDYQGASGNLIFDEYGDITQALYGVYKVENSEYVKKLTVPFNLPE